MKVISFYDEIESKEYQCQKLMYQTFINEMQEMISPGEASFDATRLGSSFCSSCDPRVSLLMSKPLGNDSLLERQLRFEPVIDPQSGAVTHGNWTIYRFWRAGWEHFPRCEDLARETAGRLIRKLNSLGKKGRSSSAMEVTFKVQSSFAKSRVRWATDDDMAARVTFLPQLVHVNPQSRSTPLRVCVIPNRELFVNKEFGWRSYNSFIRKNSLQLPSFLRFSLVTALSIDSTYLDVEDAYGCIKNSLADARHSIVLCLRTKGGLPSYDLNQCPDGILHPLVQTSSSFGQQDVSRMSQIALSRMASVYKEHCANSEIDDDVLADVQAVLTSFSYADDSQIPAQSHRVMEWSQRRGRTPPKPSCACSVGCNLWTCESLAMTSADLQAYDEFMLKETRKYLCSVSLAFVKMANFSGHRIKFVKATNPVTQSLLDQAQVTANQSPVLPPAVFDVTRPTPAQVQAEVVRGADIFSDGGEVGGKAEDEVASQLGKTYVDGQVFLKTQKLYVCHYVGKSKRRTPAFSSYDELRQFCDTGKVRVSKVSLSSLCGQFWDPAGRHLSIPRLYVKEATRYHLLDGAKSWQEPVNDHVYRMFWVAVKAYFVVCGLPQPQSNLLLHPAARLLLLAQSDGAVHLQGKVVSLLSYMEVDGKHVGKAQHLDLGCLTNHIQISQNMPLIELLAFHKTVVAATQAIMDLKSLGITIEPSACIITCDSSTVLIQIRSKAHLYKKKIGSLISRIQLLLAEFRLCPFQQVVWIDQKLLPLESRYHADILSKSRQDKATPESILKDHIDLCSMTWIEKFPPSQWGRWLHRDAGVPRLDDRELLHDLGVDPDHLQQVKDFIERPSVVSMAAVTSHCRSPPHCRPSIVPLTGGDQAGHVNGFGDHSSTVQPEHGDVGEHGNAGDIGAHGEAGGSTVADHRPSPATAPSDRHADSDGVTAAGDVDAHDDASDIGKGCRASPVATHSECWREQLDGLTRRKHSYGLGAKSVLSIVAYVLCFVINLKRRMVRKRAGTERRSGAGRRWMDPRRWPKSLTPWCNTMLCGLSPAAGCGRPHPRLHSLNDLGDIPDSEKASGRHGSPKKHDSHFLFQKRSVVGYNLGCPTALIQAERLMKVLPEHIDADISFTELRVLAFDHLCHVNSDQFDVRGFETVVQSCSWGPRPIALGRKQRDWVLEEDTIPRLRCIDSNTPFALLCVSSAHGVSMGESTEMSKLYLVSLRIIMENETKLLKSAQQHCHSCNLSKAYHQRGDTKMRSHHLGPSGRLSALGSYPPGLSCSQVDLLGPLSYLDQMANSVKLYLLICVSYTWGVTRLVPIRSKSTESVLLGLKTLALQQSTRFELVSSDDGGEFYLTSNKFSPMEESPEEPLVKKWFDAFERESNQIELEGLGIWVKFGKSRQCSSVERRVADVKSIFKNFHLFQQDSDKTDLYEILFLCALVEHVIGSRPILVYGNRVYSLNTLRSLMMDTGLLATENDGVGPADDGVRRQRKVDKICARLSGLRAQMTRLIMSFHLETLLDNVHRRERVKHSKAVESLALGDVVFDSIGFQKTGHLTGSLAKIVGQGTSRNHVLIVKAALKSKTKAGLHSQICVSRPSNELHFVCKGTSNPVAVGSLDTFNLLRYLPSADPLSTSWTFPEIPDFPPAIGSCDSGPQHDNQLVAGESCISEREDTGGVGEASRKSLPTAVTADIPTAKSRFGRTIRRPKRFDL